METEFQTTTTRKEMLKISTPWQALFPAPTSQIHIAQFPSIGHCNSIFCSPFTSSQNLTLSFFCTLVSLVQTNACHSYLLPLYRLFSPHSRLTVELFADTWTSTMKALSHTVSLSWTDCQSSKTPCTRHLPDPLRVWGHLCRANWQNHFGMGQRTSEISKIRTNWLL